MDLDEARKQLGVTQPYNLDEMIKAMREGKSAADLITECTKVDVEENEGASSTAEQASMFAKLIAEIRASTPYIDSGWVDRVMGQAAGGANLGEMMETAKENMQRYAKDPMVTDAGGNYHTWEAIHRALKQAIES